MRSGFALLVLSLGSLAMLPSCGSEKSAPVDAGVVDAAPFEDSGSLGTAEATIRTALQCGSDPGVGKSESQELQRYEIDAKRFPDALCNDGSVASFYFRPYKGEANRNKWLLNLHGGGGCGSGPTCAARWCSCDSVQKCPYVTETTNFTRANMINAGPPTKPDDGIYLRGDATKPNPFGDYNQVIFDYCSSDEWAGSARAVPFTTANPKTGEEVTFSLHFLGAKILDANLTTLRQDSIAALTYTQAGTPIAMPDLDDADEVVVSGDSAGGSGVITSLDYMNELLRSKNSACSGSTCPLKVRGFLDAIVGPDMSKLDYGTFAIEQVRSYDQMVALSAKSPTWGRHDASCDAWHSKNKPGTEAQCADRMHVVRHHVTTPFFVRMALIDSLISGNYIERGLRDENQVPLTTKSFGLRLQSELAAFGDLRSTAEEGSLMTQAPGVFAPGCSKHDTIHSTVETFGATIAPPAGTPKRVLDVYSNWVSGAQPSNLLTQSMTLADTVCP